MALQQPPMSDKDVSSNNWKGWFLRLQKYVNSLPTSVGAVSVTSVSNADGTLTISPTTGLVVGSLNLGHSNVWTVRQEVGSSFRVSATSAFTAGVGLEMDYNAAGNASGRVFAFDRTGAAWKGMIYGGLSHRWDVSNVQSGGLDANKNFWTGPTSPTTSQTDGFSYLTGVAGTPTGVPATAITGHFPLQLDSTNNKLYYYNSGWSSLTGGGGVGPQMIFGDGSDSNVTIAAGTTTLTRDMYYNNLTINGTGKLVTAGYAVRVLGTLDISAAPADAITCSGNNGATTITGTGGSAGTSTGVSGSQTSVTGVNGTTGGTVNLGGTATSSSSTAGGNPATGGKGGNGGNALGGGGATAGAAGAFTTWTNYPRFAGMWPLGIVYQMTFSGTMNIGSAQSGGGGTGGCGGRSAGVSTTGGGGGGGGGGGSVVLIFARIINRSGSTAAGAISSKGGNGGAGANAIVGNQGGGGGGGAGGGGWIWLVYESLTGSAATNCLDASGGTGGVGGTGVGDSGANAGNGGAGGQIQAFNLSTGTSTSNVAHTAGGTGGLGGAGVGGAGGTPGGTSGSAVLSL